MDAATTSLAPANSTRGEWARFGAFLKRPTLPARAPLPRLASLVAILRLMLLDFAMMGVLLGTAAALSVVLGSVSCAESTRRPASSRRMWPK